MQACEAGLSPSTRDPPFVNSAAERGLRLTPIQPLGYAWGVTPVGTWALSKDPCWEPGENDMLDVLGLVLLREDLGQGQATLWPQSRVTSTVYP